MKKQSVYIEAMFLMNTASAGRNSYGKRVRTLVANQSDLFAMERYINDIWRFLPIPVAYLNPLGVILDVSNSLENMLHYRKEELIGGTLIGLFAEQEKMRQIQKLTLEKSRVSDHQGVVRNKEGQSIPVNISTLIRKDEQGETIGYFVALLDISKRLSAEQAFSASESQYRATLNSIGDGIHVVDKDLHIMMINDALRSRIKELGIDFEPVGRKIGDVFKFLPDTVNKEYAEVFDRGKLLVTEETVQVGNREFVSEVRKIPIFDGDLVNQVVTVIHDITAQKRDEQVKAVLYKVSREVNTALDLRELFDMIQRSLGAIIDTRNFFIALRNKGDRAISLAYFVDEREDFKSLPSGRTLTSYVIDNNRPLLVTENDIKQMKRAGQIDTVDIPAKVWLGVPLRVKDNVVGALVVHNYHDPSVYTRKDMEILEFVSEQVAAAIERKKVDEEVELNFQRLKKTSTSIIFTMAKILELRDPYTAGHQQRVARLACAIAREMGLNEEEVDGIFMAALIHDIGKIYVPAEILNRPAKLNETEMDLVKTHPSIGYDIVKEIDFSQPVDRIVVQHHERIDGSGYPNGIDGSDMILQARILAVADVVEAMASHRPYRPALSLDETLSEIDKYRDVLYDGQVVDACMKIFRDSTFRFD
ncbi:MAG: PAS domain S-box protein [candidate division WOR-3 bacterium]|nr:MAG: PAS domain S-box protein [candidate division WOR-3 bacterium]